MLWSADDCPVIVVVAQMEFVARLDGFEAAPTTDDALGYHAHPDLTLGLELLPVSALGLSAAPLLVLHHVLIAVALAWRCWLRASGLWAWAPTSRHWGP